MSLLHHHFDIHSQKEDTCFAHADNCAGQKKKNKNKTIIGYFAWGCLMGFHKKVTLSFMVTGYTCCLVDGMCGLLKQKYWRPDTYTMDYLADVVSQSSP